MIQDSDEQVLERDIIMIKARKCVDLFVENYSPKNPDELKHSYYTNKYDKDKVRRFYNSKEAKFRKMIKAAGMTTSIWTDFSQGDHFQDTKTYNFYYEGKFIFRMILYFTNKNISTGTYDELMYDVERTAGSIKEIRRLITNKARKL